jgi:hypothetical protein
MAMSKKTKIKAKVKKAAITTRIKRGISNLSRTTKKAIGKGAKKIKSKV